MVSDLSRLIDIKDDYVVVRSAWGQLFLDMLYRVLVLDKKAHGVLVDGDGNYRVQGLDQHWLHLVHDGPSQGHLLVSRENIERTELSRGRLLLLTKSTWARDDA